MPDDDPLFIDDLPDTAAGQTAASPTAPAFGAGSDEATTQAIGEEGDDQVTTQALGEEGDDQVTTQALGEEGDDTDAGWSDDGPYADDWDDLSSPTYHDDGLSFPPE